MNPWGDFIFELMEMAGKAAIAAIVVLLVALMLVGHLLSSGPDDDVNQSITLGETTFAP
jgi:hypothetical protein